MMENSALLAATPENLAIVYALLSINETLREIKELLKENNEHG